MPSTTFSYTGAVQTWVVPANVTSVEVELWGAEGGNFASGTQGRGGYSKGILAVTPGETLRFYVGQKPTGYQGGWNGGGNGQPNVYADDNPQLLLSPPSKGGGGATDVRQGGTALSNRKAVAGGGGGSGEESTQWDMGEPRSRGGSGGTSYGQRGQRFDLVTYNSGTWDYTGGGYGGTPTSGGQAQGSGDIGGTAGSLGQGGTGGEAFFVGGGGGGGNGGGGGGGYYGGGGGAANESQGNGGGGGSSYVGGVTSTSWSRGVRAGHGQAVVTWSDTPPLAPTNVEPVASASLSTDIPTLSATMQTHPAGSVVHQRVEWQLATDAGFTTEVRTVTQDASELKSSGTQTMQVPVGSALFQGTWHIRARVIDAAGTAGPWSGSHTFTVSHAPSSTGHSPTGNPTLEFGDGNHVFSWSFTDPSPVDFQSGYEVEVQRTDATPVVSSGIVASGTESVTLAIPIAEKDQSLRWRVRVRDRDNVWSSFSSWNLFKVADPGTVVVDAPTGSIATATPLAEWTPTFGGTRYQTHYQVRYKDDQGNVIHDTGWVASTEHSHQVSSPILDNGASYTVEVRVRGNEGLESAWASSAFSVAFTAPQSPLFTITDLYSTDGYLSIEWDDSRHDDDFFYYRVWRRELVDGEYTAWEMLIERNDQPGAYEYREWLAGVDRTYEYAVTQAANRFGDIVESDRFPESVTPVSEHYWLVHPIDESLTIRVERVTAEDFDEQYEQESMHVLGRGRHVDYGDRLGFTGSLTAQFRDYENGLTARDQRQKLLGIKASRNVVFLRNPFGDIWQVAVGDLAIGRVGGVGRREFFDVTIPYEEVL